MSLVFTVDVCFPVIHPIKSLNIQSNRINIISIININFIIIAKKNDASIDHLYGHFINDVT